MSTTQTPIQSWTDGYRALRKHAEAHRGSVTVPPSARDATGWPRTTGLDILVISSVFDAAVRAYAPQDLMQRWLCEADLLASETDETVSSTYAGNRSYWATLAIVAMQLDQRDAALPHPEVWADAMRELGIEHDTVRLDGRSPGGVTTLEFPSVASWDQLVDVQLHYFGALRGEDVGNGPLLARIPRTTHSDVLQLATYWTAQIARIRHDAVCYRHVCARWGAALAHVERLAKGAALDTVYARNDEFWPALLSLAIHVGASAEAPRPWTFYLLVGDLLDPHRRNGAPIERGNTIEFPSAATWDEAAQMQRTYFIKLRGEDVVTGGLISHVPRTTNSDVMQLATYWSNHLARVGEHHAADISYRHVVDRWKTAVADVGRLARKADPTTTYPRNTEFWTALMTIAIQVAVTDETPSRWTLVKEAVVYSVTGLPDTLSDAVAHAVDVGGKSVLRAFAKPLLIAGGGLLGLVLLLRGRRSGSAA